jgi:hypothetical protein
MPGHNSVNHPVRRTVKPTENKESFSLYQTCDRNVEADVDQDVTQDDVPMGMPPLSGGSVHNVNTVVQPSITVQSTARLKESKNWSS